MGYRFCGSVGEGLLKPPPPLSGRVKRSQIIWVLENVWLSDIASFCNCFVIKMVYSIIWYLRYKFNQNVYWSYEYKMWLNAIFRKSKEYLIFWKKSWGWVVTSSDWPWLILLWHQYVLLIYIYKQGLSRAKLSRVWLVILLSFADLSFCPVL